MSVAVLSALLLSAAPGAPAATQERFYATETCRTCHPAIVDQHLKSHHEKAWTNPLFQAQYFREVLPAATADPTVLRDARGCVACHAPAALLGDGAIPAAPGDVSADVAGVTCDACHTIVAFEGKRPQDGKAVRRTGSTKYGPFQGAGDWHHVYLELQTRSELCAICHEATNHHAVRVKSTFSEWKESPQARRGVQCQDCHMTVDGFATAGGTARYEQGSAAVVFGNQSQARERLYTHRFPGAHSRSQVEGALGLVVTVSPAVAQGGGPLDIRVTVDNSRAGHATPTGSADLRLLWLEVTVEAGARVLPVPAQARWGPGWTEGIYEIAGGGPLDPAVTGGDVPPGSRIYRLLLADASGKPTLASWEARSVLADSRLRAAEVRSERFRFTLPEELAGPLTVTAVLRYQSAPRALTGRLGVPPTEPVEVARASRTVELRAAP